MSRRQTTVTRKYTGTKALFLLAVLLLVFWAGHDPAGALAVLHAIGNTISAVTQAASHARSTTK
jgi:hypothetical protein